MKSESEKLLEEVLINYMPWHGVIPEICWELASVRETMRRMSAEIEELHAQLDAEKYKLDE